MPEGHIVAMGGAALDRDGGAKLERFVLDLSGKSKPRVLFVPTASGDADAGIVRFFETYADLGVAVDVLRFFRRTPADLAGFLADFDIIQVGGGNTRSMLAVWEHWGLPAMLEAKWRAGGVLCGSSAGAICWFEAGITDSIAGDLTPMRALGFVAGSFCPHYDAEPERRPTYRRLVAADFAAGYAADDGVALHFAGRDVAEIVRTRPDAAAYRVERTGTVAVETRLDSRLL